jgi:hypothetical protein
MADGVALLSARQGEGGKLSFRGESQRGSHGRKSLSARRRWRNPATATITVRRGLLDTWRSFAHNLNRYVPTQRLGVCLDLL